jgi:hypothetical protein
MLQPTNPTYIHLLSSIESILSSARQRVVQHINTTYENWHAVHANLKNISWTHIVRIMHLKDQIFSKEYQLYMPNKEELTKLLQE